MKNRKLALIGVAVAALAVGGWALFGRQPDSTGMRATTGITVPELSASQQAGEVVFNENCAACHGENGAGTDAGPPLVHRIYEPGHHGDMAFLLAARRGVVAHHWRFGNMPPVAGVTDDDVSRIVAYIRAVQRANGIY